MKFKAGDKVRLVKRGKYQFGGDGSLEIKDWAELAGMKIGSIYEISEVTHYGDIRIVGHSFIHPASKFELATPTYTEDEVRALLNQCNTLSVSEKDFDEQAWFEKNKKTVL